MKAFYIDSVDINHLYGSGGIPLFKSALQTNPTNFYFIGSSIDHKANTWHSIEIFGNTINYFSLKNRKKSILPRNLLIAFSILIHWNKIQKIDSECKVIFTRTYSILWIFSFFKKGFNVIFYAPGLGNPLEIGRFNAFSKFYSLFELVHLNALSKATSLLAAASKSEVVAINKKLIKKRSNVLFSQIPESVDPNFFKPEDKTFALTNLNLSLQIRKDDVIFSYLGRLAEVKGILLLIDSFVKFQKINSESYLLLAGDGELKSKIQSYINLNNMAGKILLLGKLDSSRVVTLINASDACLFGSFVEGFSIAMLEILACGKPIVSTKVSGTDELLLYNHTGIIVDSRDSDEYCNAMKQVLTIENCNENCRNLVLNNYTTEKQWKAIINYL